MPFADPYRPFFLAGPTGSGKSALALALARHLPAEIVNADAYQLYRGIATLTAGPTESDRQACPHHLYQILEPAESCDAGRYLSLALPVLAEISQRQRIPLVTGGSGLYLKALSHGLDDSVAVDPGLRAQLDRLSLEEIRERLARADPVSLCRIEPRNRRYLQRALEISLSAQRPASLLRTAWEGNPPGLRGVLVERPREELFARIERRVVTMFERGALAEVNAISTWSPTSLQAIGVREILAHLRGETSLAVCIESIQKATRRYARRQLTWFRREVWLHRITIPPADAWQQVLAEVCPLLGG